MKPEGKKKGRKQGENIKGRKRRMGTKGKGYKGRWKEGNRGSGVMLAEGKSEFNFNIFNSSKPCHYIYIYILHILLP